MKKDPKYPNDQEIQKAWENFEAEWQDDVSEYDDLPSKVTDRYWIYAGRQTGSPYPTTSTRSGKWLLFIPVEKIDSAWAVIKTAT